MPTLDSRCLSPGLIAVKFTNFIQLVEAIETIMVSETSKDDRAFRAKLAALQKDRNSDEYSTQKHCAISWWAKINKSNSWNSKEKRFFVKPDKTVASVWMAISRASEKSKVVLSSSVVSLKVDHANSFSVASSNWRGRERANNFAFKEISFSSWFAVALLKLFALPVERC